jgi:hypothetical protein
MSQPHINLDSYNEAHFNQNTKHFAAPQPYTTGAKPIQTHQTFITIINNTTHQTVNNYYKQHDTHRIVNNYYKQL